MSRDYAKFLGEAQSVMMSDSLKSRRPVKQAPALCLTVLSGDVRVATFSQVVTFRKTATNIEIRCVVQAAPSWLQTLNSLSNHEPLTLSYGEEEFSMQRCEEWAIVSGADRNTQEVELIFGLTELAKSREILTG